MPERDTPSPQPWYRHFWPWFILLLLASSVAAGIATVVIAVSGQDALVRDDWYEDGTAINRRLERDREASALGLAATLRADPERGEIVLELQGEGLGDLQQVELELSHATRAELDTRVLLQRSAMPGAGAVFTARFALPAEGRWYATLTPAEDGPARSWRLATDARLPLREGLRFGGAP